MWTGRRFGMILHRKNRQFLVAKARDCVVVEIHMRDLDVRRQTVSIDRKTMVMRRDLDLARGQIFYRLVAAPMPEFQLVRFSAEVADEIRELTFHPEQKIETGAGGEAILEMPAQSIKEARRFVLPWGKDAVVLEPPELIADLRRELDALEKAYTAGPAKNHPVAAAATSHPAAPAARKKSRKV